MNHLSHCVIQATCFICCIAAFWGFYDVVKNLVEDGADVNTQNSGSLWTPLHAATFQEHGKVHIFK